MDYAGFALAPSRRQDLLADAQQWRRMQRARSHRHNSRRRAWKWRPRWTLPTPLRPATRVLEVAAPNTVGASR